jgi:hypothetical protein
VRFTVVPTTTVSIVAQHSYGELVPHLASGGESVCLLQAGKVPAGDMQVTAEAANGTVAWLLRGLGLALSSWGFALLLRPLSMVSEPLPIVRDLAELGTNVAGVLAGVTVGTGTIAAAWLVYHPLASLVLVFTAGGAYMVSTKDGRKVLRRVVRGASGKGYHPHPRALKD